MGEDRSSGRWTASAASCWTICLKLGLVSMNSCSITANTQRSAVTSEMIVLVWWSPLKLLLWTTSQHLVWLSDFTLVSSSEVFVGIATLELGETPGSNSRPIGMWRGVPVTWLKMSGVGDVLAIVLSGGLVDWPWLSSPPNEGCNTLDVRFTTHCCDCSW